MRLRATIIGAAALLLAGGATAQTCSTLVTAGPSAYPPFGWSAGGKADGAAIDIAKAVATKMRRSIRPVALPSFAETLRAAREGSIDLVAGTYRDTERLAFLDYVDPPIADDALVLFVPKDKSFTYEAQRSLVGRRGLALDSEALSADLTGFIAGHLDFARSPDIDAMFARLAAGQADFALYHRLPGRAHLRRLGLEGKLVALKPVLASHPLYFAFARSSRCLAQKAAFARELATLAETGLVTRKLTQALDYWVRQVAPKRPAGS